MSQLTLGERIRRGESAIARAKDQGRAVPDWEAHLEKLKCIAAEAPGDDPKRLIEQVYLPPRAWLVEEIKTESGELRAVKICSAILEDHLWLIVDRSFIPIDGLARYYAEEIASLADKTPEQ